MSSLKRPKKHKVKVVGLEDLVKVLPKKHLQLPLMKTSIPALISSDPFISSLRKLPQNSIESSKPTVEHTTTQY
jgi:hypothetical protein